MSKRTNIRQTQIVTLTDYHRQEIEEINRDKENMLKEYEQKKEGMECQLNFVISTHLFYRITIPINEKRTIISPDKT
jgi:hypothetical protein